MKQVRPQIVLVIEAARSDDRPRAQKLLESDPMVHSILSNEGTTGSESRIRVMLKPDVEDYSSLAGSLISHGIAIKHFGEEETNLESAFMALTIGTGDKI